jgi:spore maturation protein CgeB
MKILLSGYHNPHFLTITEYIERAFSDLGHDLYIFDDRQHIIPGRVRQRIKLLNEFDLQHLNRQFISFALKVKPDIVLVTGGHRISDKALRILNAYHICIVLWTIDPPINFQPIINSAPFYNYIFCQGSEAVELLRSANIFGADWLPMGCDPKYHRPVELSSKEQAEYGHDIVFVGSYYPNRAELFKTLADFDFGVWGPGWDKLEKGSRLRSHIRAAHTSPAEWAKIYSAGKIILAIHYQDPNNRVPVYQASPRIFEAMACGGFAISDHQRDVFALFRDGEHLVSYNEHEDLVSKIKFYLSHPAERRKIAEQGRQEVFRNHQYSNRIEKLLSIVMPNKPIYVTQKSSTCR